MCAVNSVRKVICLVTLWFIEQGELCVDGGSREGGQAEKVLLEQGDVGLLVHGWHVLGQGDEKEDPTDLL